MLNCQKVFSINIDGATNAINANILAYTVPSGKEVHVGSLLCSNENTDNAQVWIYHTSSAETLDVNRDRVSPGTLVAGNGGSGGSGISLDGLYAADLEYLVFTNGNKNYKVKVLSDGNFVIREWDATITKAGNVNSTWGVYVNPLLNINSIYCGGAGSEKCLCSHNFVELANSSESDVNLNGLFLLYTDGSVASSGDTGYAWKVLPLKGVIKAGSTFLIRGAQCNTPKASFINVDNYDMEWYDGTSLITFK